MTEIATALAATPPAELVAVLLAIAYLVLAIRQSPWCWAAAIGSTSIYVVLMYDARLYMESALQFFYIAIAVYGWWHWTHPAMAAGVTTAADRQDSRTAAAPTQPPATLPVTTWPLRHHLAAITAVLALSAASGWLLARHTDAALPYLDSFTTWGAVLATWMVARKLLENWYYWFIIDSAAIWLYLHRGLHLTALLFALYLVLIVIGYLAWRRSMLGGTMVTSVAGSP
jgi:nicotinamide mononucleotide transporter